MKRIKTRHTGVYYRVSQNRIDQFGRPDKCFDIHFKLKGKDIWEKVGWKSEGYSLQDAIELRAIRIKSLRHPELIAEEAPETITLNEVWVRYKEQWLPHLKAQKSMLYSFERHISKHLGKYSIEHIGAFEIENFKNNLLKNYTSANTKYILSILRRVLNKAKEWELTQKSYEIPLGSFRISNSDKKRERFLTPEEAARILDGLQFYNCTLYYIAKLSLYTGMRLGEIISLSSGNINIDAGIIYIDGKTGRRVAYISEHIKSDIRNLLPQEDHIKIFDALSGKHLIANTISEKFAKFMKHTGFNDGITDSSRKIVFHTFRHTFCSWLAMNGVPLFTIGQLVGHSSTSMTERYAKLSPDYKREALEHIHGMLAQNHAQH